MPELLVCPECKNTLMKKENKLVCNKCGKECSVDGTLYDFMGSDNYYWGEISLEEMEKTLEVAKNSGWRTAVRKINISHPNPDFGKYIVSSSRIDWLSHCIDYSHTGVCLDIGSGWGANAFGLAHYYNQVWSLEAVKQRVIFQKIRQEQDHIDNIKFVRTDWLHLPFPDNYFDLVVANGALEWVGLSDYSKYPRDLQIEFLKETRRVLKPNGCLYIGIENRYALSLFFGSVDHSGLPFTSIIPRKLADLVVRRSGKSGEYGQHAIMKNWRDYRTYTYSQAGYEKLLRAANYNYINCYWSTNYNMPKVAGRLHDESFPYYLKTSRRNTTNVKNKTALLGYLGSYVPNNLLKWANSKLCESFLIFSYKENNHSSFESNLLNGLDPNLGFLRVSGGGGESTDYKINYFILKGNEAISVMKFPRDRKSIALALEEKLQTRFNGIDIKEQVVDVVPIFIEPVLPGVHLHQNNLSHNTKALTWLINFQNQTKKGYWNAEDLENEINELDDYLLNLELQENIKMRTLRRMREFSDCLRKVKIPITAEHGDYCSVNILIDHNSIYVIDWEFYREDGNPLFDIIFFMLMNLTLGTFPKSIRINGKDQQSKIFKMLLSEYSKAMNLTQEFILQAFPYVILRCLKRNDISENGKQLDTQTYLKLLILWDEVAPKTIQLA